MTALLLLTSALAALPASVPQAPTEPATAEVPADDEPAVAESSEGGLLVKRKAGPTLLLVVGMDGTPEYGAMFAAWADRWTLAAERGGVGVVKVSNHDGAGSGLPARERIRLALDDEPKESADELWIVLIGHGTFDGRAARFNLVGPDLTADDLAGWLDRFERPVAVVNCASASGPFLTALSRPGRVILTATKSGQEQNFARLGDQLSQQIGGSEADLDRDGQTSLLEAWLMATRRTDEFYFSEGRIPSEHALLDDTGEGEGTRPDLFQGLRLENGTSGKPAGVGQLASQFCLVRSADERTLPAETRRRRDALEREIAGLRDRKSQFPPDEYYGRLEELLVRLATMTAEAEAVRAAESAGPSRR